MKVVGYTEEGDMLLIIPGDSLEAALEEDSPRARVLWISQQLLSTPQPLYRLLETRNWQKTEYPDEELPEILAGVTVQGPPIDAPWR
jgi:hypothetical protein